MKKKKRYRLKAHIRKKLFIFCFIAFIFGIYTLLNIHFRYQKIEQLSNELHDNYVTTLTDEVGNEKKIIDWDNLINRNSDVIGWIFIPDTNISYPILQGDNNEVYLHTNIDGHHSIAGSIFMQANNDSLFGDLNTIIHGHNMRNGSKFADISCIATGQLEIPTHIHIYLPDGRLKIYQIVSVNQKDIHNELYQSRIRTLAEYLTLFPQGSIHNKAFYEGNVERILTLSTCRGFGANTPLRSVIYAIFEQEIIP